MAWDKARPYAPFKVATGPWGAPVGSMLARSETTPSERDVAEIWAKGAMPADWINGMPRIEFRPFHDVPMTLTFDKISTSCTGTNTLLWHDDHGREYPMFLSRANEMLEEDALRKVITGRWTVEKRGTRYGIMPMP